MDLPSPSRTPPGYTEVDEDGDGSPDLYVPVLTPATAAGEAAVETAMVVDDASAVYSFCDVLLLTAFAQDMSSLRYPSYEGSGNLSVCFPVLASIL